MIKKILNYFINKVTYAEYLQPVFGEPNERPVEYRFVFEQIATFYPKKILDVGTGLTALPHLMANCGCNVTATDNVKDYWPDGLSNRHYHVIDDDIADTKLTEKFNMITCVSTLEHIDKADQAVKNMFTLLNPGGILVLTFPYNEVRGVPNVYELPNSVVKKVPKFKTRAYSRADLNRWENENGARIVNQEYWQFFSGDYWTVGEKILPPKKVSQTDRHQISCVTLQKKN